MVGLKSLGSTNPESRFTFSGRPDIVRQTAQRSKNQMARRVSVACRVNNTKPPKTNENEPKPWREEGLQKPVKTKKYAREGEKRPH